MNAFLESLAEKIILETRTDFSNVLVILPNKRAGLFLKKELAKKVGKPFFSPEVFGTEDFVQSVTGLKIQSPTFLIFDLFTIHKEIEQEKSRTFSDFSNFGEILLSDFNDIDLHLADAHKIFTFLNDEKELSLWNPDGSELTDFQKDYLHFYQSLTLYYGKLNRHLEDKKIAYKGMAYKYLAENLAILDKKLAGKKIWIAGFNALTQSEYALFKYLIENFKANILWDADDYYMKSPMQEAGFFLRNYKDSFKNLENYTSFFDQPKNIEILGAADNVLQAKFAGEKITDLLKTGQLNTPENTAIILADENLLIPLLNSLPKELDSVNITMGYPFGLSPVHDCVLKILQLHKNREKFKNKGFLYKDLLEVLLHPFVQKIFEKTLPKSQLLTFFNKKNSFYITEKEIPEIFAEFALDYSKTGFLFETCENTIQILEKISRLPGLFLGLDSLTKPEKEFAYAFYKLIVHLQEIQSQYQAFDSQQSLFNIYSSLAKHFKIPFYGEPLKGLQIMGLLETRTIDFERIILLSANEGNLPPAKTKASIIPIRIKAVFGMHTYKENDAIYAYHFYRLLQIPKEIQLLFDSNEEGMGKKEPSRFLKQIRYEMPLYSKNINVSEGMVTSGLEHFFKKEAISIPKDEFVFSKLKEQAEKGFSPSALGCYIECPLRFYFNYILKVREPDAPLGVINDATLGNVIHKVLEEIFSEKNLQNGIVVSQKLKEFHENLPQIIQKEFSKTYPDSLLSEGRNYLIVEIANQMVAGFLKRQQKVASTNVLKILETEKELLGNMLVNGKPVTIRGFADRIEQQDGIVRITDYKSALVRESDLKVKSEDLNNFNTSQLSEKVFQLLCYVWLYQKDGLQLSSVLQSGIYSLRNQSELLQLVSMDNVTEFSKAEILVFENFFQKLLEEIFNPGINFLQTENLKHCAYCMYSGLCER